MGWEEGGARLAVSFAVRTFSFFVVVVLVRVLVSVGRARETGIRPRRPRYTVPGDARE